MQLCADSLRNATWALFFKCFFSTAWCVVISAHENQFSEVWQNKFAAKQDGWRFFI